ncbi:HEAT repeats [uncultured archaeon]|nr:HEAT repeats [uncultured archaeon]
MGERLDNAEIVEIAKGLSFPADIVAVLERPCGYRDRDTVYACEELAGKGNQHALDALTLIAASSRQDAVAANSALGRIAHNRGSGMLTASFERINDPDCRCMLLVEIANAQGFNASRPEACSFLAGKLKEEKNQTVRWFIAWSLTRLAHNDGEAHFIEMLKDRQIDIGVMAAKTLEGVGTEKSLPALNDYSERMRKTQSPQHAGSAHPAEIARRALEAIKERCANPLEGKGSLMEAPNAFRKPPAGDGAKTLKNRT